MQKLTAVSWKTERTERRQRRQGTSPDGSTLHHGRHRRGQRSCIISIGNHGQTDRAGASASLASSSCGRNSLVPDVSIEEVGVYNRSTRARVCVCRTCTSPSAQPLFYYTTVHCDRRLLRRPRIDSWIAWEDSPAGWSLSAAVPFVPISSGCRVSEQDRNERIWKVENFCTDHGEDGTVL